MCLSLSQIYLLFMCGERAKLGESRLALFAKGSRQAGGVNSANAQMLKCFNSSQAVCVTYLPEKPELTPNRIEKDTVTKEKGYERKEKIDDKKKNQKASCSFPFLSAFFVLQHTGQWFGEAEAEAEHSGFPSSLPSSPLPLTEIARGQAKLSNGFFNTQRLH